MLNVGMDAATNPRGDRGRRAPSRRSSRRSGATRTRPAGSTTSRRPRSPRSAAHAKVRAIGETGLDYYRDTRRRDDQRRAFEAQIEIARERGLPIVIHARDEGGERRRPTRSSRPSTPRPAASAVILHCFSAPPAGRRRGRARLVLLVRRQRHLPASAEELREAAARGAGRADPGRDRRPLPGARSRCAASRNEPANVVATARAVAEVRGVAYEELERHRRGQRARRSSAGSASRGARLGPELPRRPQPARRDRARRGARAGRRRARGRGGGRGADRAPRAAAPRTSTRSRSTAASSRRWRRSRRGPNVEPALGRRDEARPGRRSSRRRPAMVANLPYSVATPLILRTIERAAGAGDAGR